MAIQSRHYLDFINKSKVLGKQCCILQNYLVVLEGFVDTTAFGACKLLSCCKVRYKVHKALDISDTPQ